MYAQLGMLRAGNTMSEQSSTVLSDSIRRMLLNKLPLVAVIDLFSHGAFGCICYLIQAP